jgi:hypothetical protein
MKAKMERLGFYFLRPQWHCATFVDSEPLLGWLEWLGAETAGVGRSTSKMASWITRLALGLGWREGSAGTGTGTGTLTGGLGRLCTRRLRLLTVSVPKTKEEQFGPWRHPGCLVRHYFPCTDHQAVTAHLDLKEGALTLPCDSRSSKGFVSISLSFKKYNLHIIKFTWYNRAA